MRFACRRKVCLWLATGLVVTSGCACSTNRRCSLEMPKPIRIGAMCPSDTNIGDAMQLEIVFAERPVEIGCWARTLAGD
jgi:hypothetical protein